MVASDAPLLAVENLTKVFRGPGGAAIHAVNDVSFTLRPGEITALVGESGSGKSTIGRAITRLIEPSGGRVLFRGTDIAHLAEDACRPLRKDLQIVFQDPWGALNPRLRVRTLIEEPLKLHGDEDAPTRRRRIDELADRVRLNRDLLNRFPNELSGGQLQRVCIARAIATNPAVIVLDEPTSSLDLSVRAGILKLLNTLRKETGAAMMFISHDLGTVRVISDRILVLYLGGVVEEGATRDVFGRPQHPYTQALMSAHLPPNPKAKLARHLLSGEIPSAIDLPGGCAFASRCPIAIEACRRDRPVLGAAGGAGQRAACLRIADGKNLIA
jgi:oligopeptide/dipeptide ABC transporter ATP-binding protein